MIKAWFDTGRVCGRVCAGGWLYAPRPAYWGGWALAALYNLLRDVFAAPLRPLLVFNAAYFSVWAVLGLVAIPLMRRVPLRRHWRPWLFHIVLGALLTQTDITLGLWLGERLMGFPDTAPWSSLAVRAFRECFNLGLMTYWGLLALVQVTAMRRQARERERQLAEQQAMLVRAQLENLKAQLQPHFLFNTLHAIGSLMHYDLATADRMLNRLSDLLRLALRDSGRREITLEQELELAAAYLDIEKIRFETRLAVDWQVPPSLHGCGVPPLILQPLVENAIKHGVAPYAHGGSIAIRACRTGEGAAAAIRLEVENTAGGGYGRDTVRTARQPGLGVGLANTRARLDALYGGGDSGAGLELVRTPSGAIARITLPATLSAASSPGTALTEAA